MQLEEVSKLNAEMQKKEKLDFEKCVKFLCIQEVINNTENSEFYESDEDKLDAIRRFVKLYEKREKEINNEFNNGEL